WTHTAPAARSDLAAPVVEPRPVDEQLARLALAVRAEAGVTVADAHRADRRAADDARLAVAAAHLEEVADLDLDRLVALPDLGDRVGQHAPDRGVQRVDLGGGQLAAEGLGVRGGRGQEH